MEQRPLDSRAPVPWLIGARLLNMLVVLAAIPVLIHALGRDGFALWALLLAASAVFSVLEFGMAPTYVRHAALALHERGGAGTRALLGRVLAIVVTVFALAAAPLLWFSAGLTALLQLPATASLSASRLLPAIYLCVLLRAVLQFGAHSFNAARRFRALALSAFAQSSFSNLAAALAAYSTGRLDLSLIAFWTAQLAVVGCGFLLALRSLPTAAATDAAHAVSWRSLVTHGLKVQIDDWTQVVTFQFDKFLIAAMLGLPALTPYEIANRCVQALRSIPSSGLDAFPGLRGDRSRRSWRLLVALSRRDAHGSADESGVSHGADGGGAAVLVRMDGRGWPAGTMGVSGAGDRGCNERAGTAGRVAGAGR
ncbi:MAG: oligosaccharide flippase family protein [Xanthomonadales bacterium]|nr:oligosaccharide flippase family protein [Xanthomonadales bacterium]